LRSPQASGAPGAGGALQSGATPGGAGGHFSGGAPGGDPVALPSDGGSAAVGSGGGGSAAVGGGGSAPVGGGGSAAVGGGGSGGSTGAGGSGDAPITVDELAGKLNVYGFALKNAFFLVPCRQKMDWRCVTHLGPCPNQELPNWEDRGRVFKESFKMGGDAARTYAVTIRVNGIVEGKYYSGGLRRAGNDYSKLNTAAGSDAWHVGGEPVPSLYAAYKLTVYQADGTTEVQHYYLNSFPEASGLESHQTVSIGYEATIDVPGEGVVELRHTDTNCLSMDNCGVGDIAADVCAGAREIPNEPGLSVPTSYGGEPVDLGFNVINGAQQPFHTQVVHVSVLSVMRK
jgi:hypothetical protein